MTKNNLKNKKIMRRSSKGITLIALVITIIVLLILAGISISMLSGDNSILSRAGEAKERTEESQREEQVKMAILGSYDNRANLDIDKLISNLNEIKDTTVTPTQENGTNTFPVTVDTGTTTYEITSDGNFEEVVVADRTGISVGDYITYTSPTENVSLSTAETGYTSEQTLPAKDTFRVMDIDSRGNMTLIGAMTSSDPTIYFRGALGYNNAVYTLNKKCSDLYKDTSKGITARSIKVEDITSKFNDTGNGKITTYITNQMSSLSPSTNVTKDTTNNTVTYSNGYTYYPDIFQYEAGGLLGTTATTGVIGQSDSYSGYGGLTTNGAAVTSSTKPTSLTVPYTYYNTTHVAGDFEDSAKAAAYQNMFFETGTYYWLASRCIDCSSSFAYFRLHFVYSSSLDAYSLYFSYGNTNTSYNRVCPVVYLPSSVQVEISPSTDTSTYHKTVPHVVK